jgi:exosortase A-associated hydrolase 1
VNFIERAVTFPCEEKLIGVLSLPERSEQVGVVIVVGGPQYRVGSHRQFVLLARALANAGYPVLRFDYRGMGDSGGERRNFEEVGLDIGSAIDALQRCEPSVERIVLWGLCDAASAILLYLGETNDDRVAGACLVNPWVRDQASLARTHVKHYYLQRLMQRDFWTKLVSGRLGVVTVVPELFRTLRTASARDTSPMNGRTFQQRMASAAGRFGGRVLLILSGNDYTAKEFTEHVTRSHDWTSMLASPTVEVIELPTADHTFSQSVDREEAESRTLGWMAKLVAVIRPKREEVLQ